MGLKFLKGKYYTFTMVGVFILACNQRSEKQLPVYNPSDFNPALVDKSMQGRDKNHRFRF